MLTRREHQAVLDDLETALSSLQWARDNVAKTNPPASSIALLKSIRNRLYDSMEPEHTATMLALKPANEG